MEIEQVGRALSNETRLRLLQLIADEPSTAKEAHDRYIDTYTDQKHRESIYRALETLVDAGILTKEYSTERGIMYEINHRALIVDLQTVTITPVSEDQSDDNDI